MDTLRKDHWRLCRVPRANGRLTRGNPRIDGWDDLEERERDLGIRTGQWFLLEDGAPGDPDVLAFFGPTSPLARRAEGTRRSYAQDLKTHFEFLAANGKTWRDATADDFADYEFWRRRDADNPRLVSGSKFNREIAACRLFYEWQRDERHSINASPVRLSQGRARDGTPTLSASLRSHDVRANRVNWLTPRAYRRWRDVGLAGYTDRGLRDSGWRGRNDTRNLAFVDLLWTTGLRLREGASLLVPEVPRGDSGLAYPKGRVAEAVAKGAGRAFWVSSATLARIAAYQRSTRREAVRRAQALGRYEQLHGIRRVVGIRKDEVTYLADGGSVGRVRFDALDEFERTRFFTEGPEGLEPLWLWLNEAGLPMQPASWEVVFARANERCTRFGLESLACRPHMLRHSFALRMLVGIQANLDRRFALTPEMRRQNRELFGDPFWLVKELLGHRSIDTTRHTYLAPATELQIDEILNEVPEDEPLVTVVLARAAASDPRIIDLEDDRA